MNYFFAFLELGGGVASIALSASSNRTPLNVIGGAFGGMDLLRRVFVFTNSLSAPRGVLWSWFYKVAKLSVKLIPSHRLPVGEALSIRRPLVKSRVFH